MAHQSAKQTVYQYLLGCAHTTTISRIAEQTGLARSTVSRVLLELRNENKVERELGPIGFGNLWYA